MEKKLVTRFIHLDWTQSEHIKVTYCDYDDYFDNFVRCVGSQ